MDATEDRRIGRSDRAGSAARIARTGADRPAVNADGDRRGDGRLIGVVMEDFRLSDPFVLGTRGSFVAPASGKLYLRCCEAWNRLADNSGVLRVELTP